MSEAMTHVVPVHDVPDGFDVSSLVVQVLQVEGVLPRIDHEERDAALTMVALMVVDLLDDQAFPERLPRHDTPTGALNRGGSGGELRLEGVEGTEVPVDGVGQIALRF